MNRYRSAVGVYFFLVLSVVWAGMDLTRSGPAALWFLAPSSTVSRQSAKSPLEILLDLGQKFERLPSIRTLIEQAWIGIKEPSDQWFALKDLS